MVKRAIFLIRTIQVFVALGALPAGMSMIIDPSGYGLDMSTQLLKDSPFRDFYIPGLILFIIHGLGNVAAFIWSFKSRREIGPTALGLGFLLLIWMVVQVYFLGLNHTLQLLFILIAIIELILAVILISKRKTTFG